MGRSLKPVESARHAVNPATAMRQIGDFSAARHHHVGVAKGHEARRITDGVRPRRAGRDHGVVRALQLMLDGDVARGKVDEPPRYKEGANAARSLVPQEDRGVGNARQAADTGADENARTLLLLGRVGRVAGIGERLRGRRHREDDEVVDLALLLGLHPIVGIEVALGEVAARHEAADLAGQVVDLELGDAASPVRAGDQRLPRRLRSAPHGRDHPQSCDNDATHSGPSDLPALSGRFTSRSDCRRQPGPRPLLAPAASLGWQ